MNNETEKPNPFEAACDDYIFGKSCTRINKIRSEIDDEIRQAFYAGVQFGINKAWTVYNRPEVSE
jgi:hypothetical protein